MHTYITTRNDNASRLLANNNNIATSHKFKKSVSSSSSSVDTSCCVVLLRSLFIAIPILASEGVRAPHSGGRAAGVVTQALVVEAGRRKYLSQFLYASSPKMEVKFIMK